MLRTPST